MPDTKGYKRHADLVDRMATAQGLDLQELVMRGKLNISSLGDAVRSCTACSNPDGCDAWMNVQTDTVDRSPEICRNREIFDLLKAGKSV